MSHWNYRVIRRTYSDEYTFSIYEVYYNDAGKIEGYAENPSDPFGTNLDELKQDIGLMVLALNHPILIFEELGANFESLQKETSNNAQQEGISAG